MSRAEAARRLARMRAQRLRSQIRRHDRLYYTRAQPVIADAESMRSLASSRTWRRASPTSSRRRAPPSAFPDRSARRSGRSPSRDDAVAREPLERRGPPRVRRADPALAPLRRPAAAGVLMREAVAGRAGPLAIRTFVLMGALDRFTRGEARGLIERLGVRTLDEAAFRALVRGG